MPVHPWPHLLKRLKKGHAVLGLDVGSRTIGVAISDPDWQQAIPLVTIQRGKLTQDLAQLAEIAKMRDIGGYVIGMPLHLDGGKNASSDAAELFAKQMHDHAPLFPRMPEVSFYDERLTTAQAERFLITQADVSRKRRGEVIDKIAAQIILQAALDMYNKAK